MNVSLVAIEALNDSMLLLEHADDICRPFKEAVRQERHFALMGDAAQPGEQSERQLLAYCRAALANGAADERLHAKLALALGIAASRGLRASGATAAQGPDALARDAFLYRLYYAAGDGAVRADTIRAVFAAMRQRNTIELHTFVANTAVIDEWIERMSEWERGADAEIEAFAQAVAAAAPPAGPDGQPFYDAGDALAQLLLKLRRGERPGGADIGAAVSAEPVCGYARMVKSGFAQLRAANDYFTETAASS